jgi:hypothetical protein
MIALLLLLSVLSTWNGRTYKMLTVLDEFTRQALAVTVRTRMGADDVLEALYPLLLHTFEVPVGGNLGEDRIPKLIEE